MPAPIPLPLRRLIQRRARRGQNAAAIARALQLRPRTVRQLLRRFHAQPERLAPAYRPGPGRPADRHPLFAAAVALRQQHPTWGAGYLRVRLAASAGPSALPSERTLQRWFRRQQRPPAAAGRRPPAETGRAAAPTTPGRWTPWSSYAWAAAGASAGCGWWTSTRVPSWAPRFSPHYHWAYVPEAAVQQQLRAAFARWGLPRRLRVDNGKPWGSWSDLPPALALWLIGLGLEVVWNDPCRPQQNGVVARSQGTAKRWAEPQACQTEAELQGRLDEDDALQRERYPLAQGRSRWELFPGLGHTGRPYRGADEARWWSLGRVREHLAGYAVPRRVDSQGKVSVYNRNLYVGVVHKGHEAWVQFDPEQGHWLISDSAGRQLRTQPAPEISAQAICGLRLAGRK